MFFTEFFIWLTLSGVGLRNKVVPGIIFLKIPDIHKDIIYCILVETQLVPLYLGPGACMSIRCMGAVAC